MIRTIYILLLAFVLNFTIQAQQTQATPAKPTIESKSFDRTVSRMIKETVPLIGVEELRENQDKYIILDAREMEEYKVSHLEKAQYIGYDDWDESILDELDKNVPIVIYCSIGVRSEKIGEKLQKRGFTDVKNLYGSIFEWANKGYPVVDNAGYPTMKIHGYSWLWGKWMTNDKYEKVY